MTADNETVVVKANQSFYTPLVDCVRWAMGLMLFLALVTVAGFLFRAYSVGGGASFESKPLWTAIGFEFLIGVVLGLAVFFFGWLGRVTIGSEGVKAPRYSGLHEFVQWSDVEGAEQVSLSGWPSTLVRRVSGRAPIYLMVIGRRRKEMIECILALAPPNNPLVQYFSANGA